MVTHLLITTHIISFHGIGNIYNIQISWYVLEIIIEGLRNEEFFSLLSVTKKAYRRYQKIPLMKYTDDDYRPH